MTTAQHLKSIAGHNYLISEPGLIYYKTLMEGLNITSGGYVQTAIFYIRTYINNLYVFLCPTLDLKWCTMIKTYFPICYECGRIRNLRIIVDNHTNRDIRLSPKTGSPTLTLQCFEYMNELESWCKLGYDWSIVDIQFRLLTLLKGSS